MAAQSEGSWTVVRECDDSDYDNEEYGRYVSDLRIEQKFVRSKGLTGLRLTSCYVLKEKVVKPLEVRDVLEGRYGMQALANLEELTFSSVFIQEDDIKFLAAAASSMPCLKKLRFFNCFELSTEDFMRIVRAGAEHWPLLNTFEYDGMEYDPDFYNATWRPGLGLRDDALLAFVEFAQKSPCWLQLQNLHLTGVQYFIGDDDSGPPHNLAKEGYDAITASARTVWPQLITLSLDDIEKVAKEAYEDTLYNFKEEFEYPYGPWD